MKKIFFKVIFYFIIIIYATPEMALTKVDLPCATWPIVPEFLNL